MILVIDDERDIFTITGLKYRQLAMLPGFTDEQKAILVKDIRRNVVHVKNYDEAIKFLSNNTPEMIFFDNDIASDKEGYDILKWYLDKNPARFEAYFHTCNMIARKNMVYLYESYKHYFWNQSKV